MSFLRKTFSAFVGTSLMTLFSFAVSRNEDKQFREPHLINELISGTKIKIHPSKKSSLGWLLHYSTGPFFTICYYLFWKWTPVKTFLLSGIIMGVINGGIGIIAWKIAFSIPANPPNIKLKDYYGHLIGDPYNLWI
ncbi:MAG TPA: hypothetical protein VK106_03750 [Balneolaceae bacterium]|nr:hypothetical protein [Balneolaceae bacterium]